MEDGGRTTPVVIDDPSRLSHDRLKEWDADLQARTIEIAGSLFHRPEPKGTFVDFLRGLLSDVPRKNFWQITEYLGYESPSPLEWLLNGAVWDA